ncbi:Holliday junction resolvase RecU [Fictibacillus nanhaiensis]|uniref:Holliday junction resolvase RecU n=1 Tax=Fictibacillus nanhaiensis TaxID=742169 RepID=UPI002E212B20|nr:Holliday junction resolvase RecU [Fictibacillus nanhaiensis]MED1863409.1 Holliday junction resolvase RecU [Fictibacillus nanhaiensis]
MAKGTGKLFEEEIQTSSAEQRIWFFRVRDVNPMAIKPGYKTAENPYDSLIYYDGHLFPTELKSTKGKSLPFKNIKDHQIESLIKSNTYDRRIIPGFIINFSDLNRAFFLQIDDFMEYMEHAKDNQKTCRGFSVNDKSLTLDYCEGIGIEITGHKKKVKMRWYVNELCKNIINKYK